MSTRPLWLSSLPAIVEPNQIASERARVNDYAVDGCLPQAIVYPETFDQVAAVLRWAQTEKLAVLPWGSGTLITLGAPPERLDLVLSTSRLQRISEYDAANFTLTAEAGVSFSQVAGLVAGHMQTLPLQYAFSPATLGGIIATNAESPKRLRYGGVRDLLLGMRIALPSGEIAHFGGKVVKNVAGYDMCKLFLGSLGALGVILEATFKLYTVPERDDTLLAVFSSLPQAAAAVAQLITTPLLPSQILLLNWLAAHASAPSVAAEITAGGALLLVNFEGLDEAVERQLSELSQMCRRHGSQRLEVLSGEAQLQLRQRLEAATRYAVDKMRVGSPHPSPHEAEGMGDGTLVVRLGTLPSRVHTVMDSVAQVLTPLASHTSIVGDCGLGLVRLCVRGLAVSAVHERLVGAVRELPRLVAADGGYVVVEAAPPDVKQHVDVWGPPPSAFALLKALKRKFDPEGILNPGRFIGGL
jgi:glycolate oxidase FAD binding subunit